MSQWCECDFVTKVSRDGRSTCQTCGGMDAYKKSPLRPSGKTRQEIADMEAKCAKLRAELLQKDAIINGLITGQSNGLAELAAVREELEAQKSATEWHGNSETGLAFTVRDLPKEIANLKAKNAKLLEAMRKQFETLSLAELERDAVRTELAEAREALHRKCQCDFRDGIQVSECHLHAVQRSGRRENGDPKEWRSKPEQFIAGEVVPVDRLRALCAKAADILWRRKYGHSDFECEHGIMPWDKCPNAECEDRDDYKTYLEIKAQGHGEG